MAETYGHNTPSRYKSHRRQQGSADEVEPPASPSADDGINRSKSRYRRKPNASATSPPAPQEQSLQNAAPSRYHSKNRQSPLKASSQDQGVQEVSQLRQWTGSGRGRMTDAPSADPGTRNLRNFSGDEVISDAENDMRHMGRAGQHAGPLNFERVAPRSASPPANITGELFPPPKPFSPPARLDGPPLSENIRATKSMSELPTYSSDSDTGCFGGLFKRRRGEGAQPASGKLPTTHSQTKDWEPLPIKAGGGGIVPGTDAPISAINAGDSRHVLVQCGKSKTLFPVTHTTTPVDLIKSSATCMSEHINVKSAVLLESFDSVGVQRPLRRYEHIRDILNSWDNDRQNALLLVDPATGTVEPELTAAGAPTREPMEQSWPLAYSQKLGKWEKRFITLRSNGQIVCLKDPEKPSEAANVCHLSDFDIYSPTPERQKRKIKPPKKFCYAVKSQQKTSLFESTHDFVHFFSTGDPAVADSFYAGVQRWRSWYLVNVKGEGKEKAQSAAAPTDPPPGRSISNDHSRAHRAKESIDPHYQLGTFRGFSIDMDQFDTRPGSGGSGGARPSSSRGFNKAANQFDVNVSPERRTSAQKRQHPPVALSNRAQLAEDEPLANLNRNGSTNRHRSSSEQKRPHASELTSGAQLGRNYSYRYKDLEGREPPLQKPLISGLNTVNGAVGESRRPANSNSEMKRADSTRNGDGRQRGHARGASVELDRSGSRRQKPKPLVDLTPEFCEPPQHSKKGRGYHPETIREGGLIADATSPEDPLGVPVQTVFRNTSGQYSGPTSPGLIDLTPQYREPVHQAKKGRGYFPDESATTGGLIGSANSPDDPLSLQQHAALRNPSEGHRRTPSTSEHQQQQQQQQQSRSSARRAHDAFTGEGLLANAENRQGWGGNTLGRGVIDGSRANGKPLVDLNADSRFVQGSLLNMVERAEGGPIPAPVIDRGKREERLEKYGEGF